MLYFKDSQITIRDIEKSDLISIFNWWVDKRVNKFDPRVLPNDASSLIEECNRFCINFESEVFNDVSNQNIYRYFMIDDSAGYPIGFINIFDFDAEKSETELGIIIGEMSYWHTGVATKSLKVIIKYLFEDMMFKRICIETNHANEPARKLFLKLGFKECGEDIDDGHKFLVMKLQSKDFLF
ncbi:GNAT family N-acetyltransferase [Acidaminobacter sp. JC074]|uniref:GNAT family N-acetyltransferase n=1 Tax=Acidaminobacter sp. JC074 TaxID=2530199 RepID=UPI001F0E8F93|nr:GNAT family N-acetyltransferase [Acidaminobacter sp. JC074]MCH4891375.1 GNAT family N-acetyltransferase [Acidaminobacter sp. JC074]